jgi:hypothetical protein
MQIVIAHQTGRIHHAAGHSALQKTRPTYAFLPDGFVVGGGFAKAQYLASRWPSINTSANPNAIGSHIIPDASKPVSPRSRCPVLREFLTHLKIIAVVKATPKTE